MLELVHDALDSFLLCLRLVSGHWLTSLYQILCGNRRPVFISSGISIEKPTRSLARATVA
jgi:hypothetical protein